MEQKQDNLIIWNNLKQVPPNCLKKIKAGRLKGMSDVKPQWRLQAMTHQFGPCGIGWKYIVTNKWLEDGSECQKVAFVDIDLFFKWEGEWSAAIPGTGGSSFIAKEHNGPYTSDEAYKMATTDALSVAMKTIGVASDIYMGAFYEGKYADTSNMTRPPVTKEALKENQGKLAYELDLKLSEKDMTDNEKIQIAKFYCIALSVPVVEIHEMPVELLQDFTAKVDSVYQAFVESLKNK